MPYYFAASHYCSVQVLHVWFDTGLTPYVGVLPCFAVLQFHIYSTDTTLRKIFKTDLHCTYCILSVLGTVSANQICCIQISSSKLDPFKK